MYGHPAQESINFWIEKATLGATVVLARWGADWQGRVRYPVLMNSLGRNVVTQVTGRPLLDVCEELEIDAATERELYGFECVEGHHGGYPALDRAWMHLVAPTVGSRVAHRLHVTPVPMLNYPY